MIKTIFFSPFSFISDDSSLDAHTMFKNSFQKTIIHILKAVHDNTKNCFSAAGDSARMFGSNIIDLIIITAIFR